MSTQPRRLRQATEYVRDLFPALDLVPVLTAADAVIAAGWWFIAHITHNGPPAWWIPVVILAVEALMVAGASGDVDTLIKALVIILHAGVFLAAWLSREQLTMGRLSWWILPTGLIAIEALLYAGMFIFWRPPAEPAQLVGLCTGCGQTVHGEPVPGRYRTDTGGYPCPVRMHLHDRRHQLVQPTPAGQRLHPAGRQ